MTRFMLRVIFFTMLAFVFGSMATSSAKADCGLSLLTNDTSWSFSAGPGGSQSRGLVVENTTTDSMVIVITTGCDAFSVAHDRLTIVPNDTTSILVTFHPSQSAQAGTVYCTLTVTKYGTDCKKTLGLVGTITGNNNGGGDKVLRPDPASYNFGYVIIGSDSCRAFYLMNQTGGQVTVTGMSFLHTDGAFTLDPSYSKSFTIDSGGYYRYTICYHADSVHAEVSDSLKVTYTFDGATHAVYVLVIGHNHTNSNNGGGNSAGELYASPHEISYGTVTVGKDSCVGLTIYNTDSTRSITITGWNFCDSGAKVYSATPPFNGNITLTPGQTKNFKVCFAPDVANKTTYCNLTFAYYFGDQSQERKSLIVSLAGNSGTNTVTQACLKFEQGDGYKDPVVIGASANRTLQVINPNDFAMTVTGDSLTCSGAKAFTIDQSQFPLTVPANSTVNLKYIFTPYTIQNGGTQSIYEGCLFLHVSSDTAACTLAHAGIYGFSQHDSDNHSTDPNVRPLFPTEPRIVSIESFGQAPSKTFYFMNNLGVDVTVNNVSLKDGQYFAIGSTNPATPFLLHPNAQFSVTIVYTATDNAVHHDTLLFTTTHSIVQAGGFELQGVKAATSNVRVEVPNGVTISITPNPMTSNMTATVTGIRSATIEIYDMLGNLMISAPTMGVWSWNATTSNGEHIANGSYFVRINGVSNDGIPFVTTKRIIVAN